MRARWRRDAPFWVMTTVASAWGARVRLGTGQGRREVVSGAPRADCSTVRPCYGLETPHTRLATEHVPYCRTSSQVTLEICLF